MRRQDRPTLGESSIRRRAIRMLRSLDLPASDDVELLCQRLGEHRQRPIVLMPRSFPRSSAFGLWLKTDDADLVFYEQDATPEHQRHIIRHEIGHILFDHAGDSAADDRVLQALAPSLPAHVVRSALQRSCYDTAAEWEAEVFASIITDLTGHTRTSRGRSTSANRLEEAFDDPWGL